VQGVLGAYRGGAQSGNLSRMRRRPAGSQRPAGV